MPNITYDENGKPEISRKSYKEIREEYKAQHPDAFKWDAGESLTGVRSKQEQKTPQQPAQPEAPAPLTEADGLKALVDATPAEELEKLISEYDDNTDFVTYAKEKLNKQQEAQKPKIDTDALHREYRERLAKIPNGRLYEITELKKEYRQRGLDVN